MAMNPRAALDRLMRALEHFHQVASTSDDPHAPAVLEATDLLADAFTVYDDVMFTEYDVETPFDVYADEDEDEDNDNGYLYDTGRFDTLDDDDDDEDFDDDYDDEDDDEDDEDFDDLDENVIYYDGDAIEHDEDDFDYDYDDDGLDDEDFDDDYDDEDDDEDERI
ncbi:hypothetical protein CJ184_007280 [Actinotignum urinale]|uniref:hypothetical protein n=1 Tax=Actinotignum urinale TaxID=190146 RepID=UPI000C7FD74E|nr:hypothetical protein [Actinotignum urinale]MDY5128895.1 hypothetical protein [Actinotignum urinale]WIK59024.1 hypothetical protein CJ184_007280 [Actinotignum urinale]